MVAKIQLDAPFAKVPRRPISSANESLAKKLLGGRVRSSSPSIGRYDNAGEGSIWLLNHILEFCEKIGLEVEAKETKVFDFLAALEAVGKKVALRVDEDEEAGEDSERGRCFKENIKIIS